MWFLRLNNFWTSQLMWIFVVSSFLCTWICMLFLMVSLTLLFDVLFSISDGCVDPFTSSESVDDSIPHLNPFLSKPVDAVPPPSLSSDAVSFPSRTPSHEMFSGKRIFFCPSQHHILFAFCLFSVIFVCIAYLMHVPLPIILNHSLSRTNWIGPVFPYCSNGTVSVCWTVTRQMYRVGFFFPLLFFCTEKCACLQL